VRARLLPADLDHAVSSADAAMRALAGARVLVTGASGFVGGWMLESLLHARDTLAVDVGAIALTRDRATFARRLPHLAEHPAVAVVEADVRSCQPGAFTHVVHAASAATPAENAARPDAVIDLIAAGTRHVCAVSAQAGASRMLVVSSGSVYDRRRATGDAIDESCPTVSRANTTAERFGAAKADAEQRAFGAGTPAVAARIFTVVGPRLPLDGQFAVGQFFGDAVAGRAVRVTGDGSPVRTYLYAADLAAWCWTLLVRGTAGSAYNVGSDVPLSVGDAAQAVAALAGVAVHRAAGATAGTPSDRYVPSIARARAELGVAPWVDASDAFRRTWDWLRS
jgi:dTDP-glucose 4,6-dehydratase